MISPKSAPSARVPLQRLASFAEARELWSSAALAGERGVFATWEWNEAWWRHYGAGELLLHVARTQAGAPRVILPCYERRVGPARVVRFVGHGPGDELGPLYAPGDARTAADAIDVLLAGRSWSALVAEQLPGEDDWPALLRGRRWRRESNRVLELPAGGWQAFLDGCSANLRQQIGARRRRLERAGVVITAADASTLERDFETLVALHRQRWGDRSDFAPHLPFHRSFARVALDRGWLRLWIARLADRPLAAWYGFHVGATLTYYQAGRDPAHDRLAPGFVLMAHALEASLEAGARHVRLGRGDEPFKHRLAPHDAGLDTVVLTDGRVAATVVAGASALRRARRRLLDARRRAA